MNADKQEEINLREDSEEKEEMIGEIKEEETSAITERIVVVNVEEEEEEIEEIEMNEHD